jgi:SAM-dependent methyltransferase
VVTAFERSAEFYDDLYEGKDYAAEADYVDALIQRHLPGPQSLLDLGCGTGRHAIKFAEKGYSVVGIDRSPEMIAKAQRNREQLPPHLRERLTLEPRDIRDFRLGRQFDAVVALFHVISYQTSNDDLLAAFTTARSHLRENGLFIFDCWYGPGVLSDPPVVRVKRLQRGLCRLLRIAEPRMRINDDLVEIRYEFLVSERRKRCSEFHEIHKMRYFFIPELSLALRIARFRLLAVAEWMTAREPDETTWNVSVVAQTEASKLV